MDILYRRGQATAAEIHATLPDPPSYSAVRALLRVLEEKGHVRHREKNLRYVYLPVVPRDKAAEVLKKAQELDDTEHRMYPFLEKFKSMKEALARFGRI